MTTLTGTPVDNITTAELSIEFARRHAARENLIEFAQYMDDAYEAHRVHQHIARALERVESGESRRLAIFVPPATGKSELVSRTFPAWVMGRNPRAKIIETSYNADLAQGFGRQVRNKIEEPAFARLFPDCTLSETARAADAWETTAGGTYKAEGVEGGLIGFHGHIAIIDDPVSGADVGSDKNRQEKLWNWYTGTLLNRLRPYKNGPGAIILIMQRWHDRDLGGRVLEHEDWDVVRLPQLAEHDDPLGRAPGEPLLPEWRSSDEIEKMQRANPRMFVATQQQKPIADDGEIFDAAWFRTWRNLPEGLTYYGASDYAVSENEGDYTVHLIAGVDNDGCIYLVDAYHERAASNEWVEAYLEFLRQYEPFMWAEEKGQIIKGVGPFMELRMREEGLYTIRKPFVSSANKVIRSRSIAGMAQMGRVYLPHEAPWVGDFLHECTRFPAAAHDDYVDAFALLGRMLTAMRASHVVPSAPESHDEERNPTFNEVMERVQARRRGLHAPAAVYAH